MITEAEYRRAFAYVLDRHYLWTRADYEDGGESIRRAKRTIEQYELQRTQAQIDACGRAMDRAHDC